jgi:murein DD-endopeptidase MepM/ murein hydrolase activator NlpD
LAKLEEGRAFGRKRVEHLVIFASGDKIRHMTVRPWMAALACCFIAVFSIGYLLATTYLIIRDDLIGATVARQARMQHDYEDRIASLRAQLDRVTSRQLMDQQLVEQKIEKLLEQQSALFSRHGKLGTQLDRAEQSGLNPSPDTPSPAADKHEASLGGGHNAIDALLGLAELRQQPAAGLAYAPMRENLSDHADHLVSKVSLALKSIEQEQLTRIADLTSNAEQTATAIADIMKRTGIDVGAFVEPSEAALGGPFVEPETASSLFDSSLDELDAALNRLEAVRETAKTLPYGNPAPGRRLTSQYGNRIDPFLGRLALHAGIDFQADTGAKVYGTGAGKVITAEFSGGYGNLVEIDHGHGITTRYGHLSRILVSKGDAVEAGDVVGRAGSTGRSTGPHVHYEVRRDGQAVNPVHFLNAGMKLTGYFP